jgi:hypothetical protein
MYIIVWGGGGVVGWVCMCVCVCVWNSEKQEYAKHEYLEGTAAQEQLQLVQK